MKSLADLLEARATDIQAFNRTGHADAVASGWREAAGLVRGQEDLAVAICREDGTCERVTLPVNTIHGFFVVLADYMKGKPFSISCYSSTGGKIHVPGLDPCHFVVTMARAAS